MPARKRRSGQPLVRRSRARPLRTSGSATTTSNKPAWRLLQRLDCHMKITRTHPSANRALKLLNTTFRNAKVAQRAAILQAAEWLITLIENTPPML